MTCTHIELRGDEEMMYPKYLMLLAAFFLLLPLSAFAPAKDQGTFRLFEPAKIGSTQLQPGKYKVEWTGTDPKVRVTFLQGKKTVAVGTATLETEDRAASQDAVVLKPASNNSSEKQIIEIDFGSRREALVILPTS
jgi:hypothetical protein